MSDYPSLSSTTRRWGSRSDKNKEHLLDVLQTLLRCEVESEGISSFLLRFASRVETGGDICSLAEERMKQNRKTRKSIDKSRLNPWINEAKSKLDESQRGLESTAAFLDHEEASALAFSELLAGALINQTDRNRRIGIFRDRITSLESRIKFLHEKVEAWDEF